MKWIFSLYKLTIISNTEVGWNLKIQDRFFCQEHTFNSNKFEWIFLVWWYCLKENLHLLWYVFFNTGIYSAEAMKNYKSLEAYRFFISGWVGTVTFLQTVSLHYIFKANVKPSFRVNNTPHHPWVAVNEDGQVLAGHCDCMAG